MIFQNPILTSLLDTDLYKITQGQVVFHDFPEAIVEYTFMNRGKTLFPVGFGKELENHIGLMSVCCRMTKAEYEYLSTLSYFRPNYLEWLRNYIYNPNEVTIIQSGHDLIIKIRGPWYRVILWEVPLMAMISELYFKMLGSKKNDNWENIIFDKSHKLSRGPIPHKWSDFGTRRRFSFEVQNQVVNIMKHFLGFLGTSNPLLAMNHGVRPIGTMAHEFIMGLSAKYGISSANLMAMKHWSNFYQGELGIALPDTFTTEVFLRDFNGYYTRLFDGIRQDSGDPMDWADELVIPHYQRLGIPTLGKKLIFSDGLNVDKYIELSNRYRDRFTIIGGIGTNLTNDVGVKPLNMVIKLTRADFGRGMIDVIKLSDSKGKHTGNQNAIDLAKEELGI